MQIKEEIKKICPQVKFNEPLAKHTSFRIGGPAEYFIEIKNRSELVNLLKVARKYNLKVFPFGAGTNLLIKDKRVKGLVIKLNGEFKKIEISGEKVKVGAGVLLPQLIKQCARNNLGGMEFLAGIPGTVGGALVMNAGNPEEGIGDLVERVEVMSPAGEIKTLQKKDLPRTFPQNGVVNMEKISCCSPSTQRKVRGLHFSYRSSNLPAGSFILSCWLKLKKSKKDVIMKIIKEQLRKRWEKQPRGLNAGSIFKNPPADSAGRLIEQAGLKGVKYSDAYISEKHANFIINRGKAKAKDILYLIKKIKETVRKKFGVQLKLEIRVIGE